jgi:phosphate butyryltransferase
MITSFADLLSEVKGKPKKNIAVAMAEEEDVLMAISAAHTQGIANAVLVGHREKIVEIAEKHQIDIKPFDIVNAEEERQAVAISIQLVRERLADTLMKGKCSSATLLKGVLDKEQGLRSGKLLSHLAAFEVPYYPKLIMVTDAAMNIAPDLSAKVSIIENAVQAAKLLGIAKPKVAVIAAVEKVNYDSMPCTVDAALLSQMAARGQIKDAIVDGPLALDNAVSVHACEVKGIQSPVNGEADILMMPDIEAGNVFYKTMTYLAGSKVAGIIVGAQVPIILTSRSDSDENKFLSIAFGLITSVRNF